MAQTERIETHDSFIAITTKDKRMKNIKSFPLELGFWITSLMLLAMANPHEHHFTLCPLANLGIDWCPGCGLGRSISSLFQGELKESFNFHWFGLPALMLIIYRIVKLVRIEIKRKKEFNLKYKED